MHYIFFFLACAIACGSTSGQTPNIDASDVDPNVKLSLLATTQNSQGIIVSEAGELVATLDTSTDVHLSRDGTHVLFGSSNSQGVTCFAGLLGRPQVLTTSQGTIDKCFGISNDGSLVAYVRQGSPEEALHIADKDGTPAAGDGALRAIQIWGAQFLSDNTIVAIVGIDDSGPLTHFNPTSSIATRISDTKIQYPFDVSSSDKIAGFISNQLFVIDLQTGEEEMVFEFPSFEHGCDFDAPDLEIGCFLDIRWVSWSPDGDKIALSADSSHPRINDRRDVFVLTLGSGNLRKFSDGVTEDSSPVFNARGDRLYWIQSGNLVGADLTDGQVTTIIEGGVNAPLSVSW